MAYDQKGNYYFDPAQDIEDQQLLDDELKREKAREFVLTQRRYAHDSKMISDSWIETLKSEGLDPTTYGQLVSEDPELARTFLKEGMKHMVSGVKRGGKGKKETQASGHKERPGQTVKLDKKFVEGVREKAKRGQMTDDDRIDVLDALIGNLI